MPANKQLDHPRVVRIRNDGDTDYTQKYDGERYLVKPNSETLISWEAMCLWFGHPKAVDIDKKNRFRTDEVKRLDVKYGVYERHDMRERLYPKISVWDLGTMQQIITVIDDPEGKHLTPESTTIAQNQTLQNQLAIMQEQMAVMQAQIEQQNKGDGNPMLDVDFTTDESPNRPEVKINIDGLDELDSADLGAVDVPNDTPTKVTKVKSPTPA